MNLPKSDVNLPKLDVNLPKYDMSLPGNDNALDVEPVSERENLVETNNTDHD